MRRIQPIGQQSFGSKRRPPKKMRKNKQKGKRSFGNDSLTLESEWDQPQDFHKKKSGKISEKIPGKFLDTVV